MLSGAIVQRIQKKVSEENQGNPPADLGAWANLFIEALSAEFIKGIPEPDDTIPAAINDINTRVGSIASQVAEYRAAVDRLASMTRQAAEADIERIETVASNLARSAANSNDEFIKTLAGLIQENTELRRQVAALASKGDQLADAIEAVNKNVLADMDITPIRDETTGLVRTYKLRKLNA